MDKLKVEYVPVDSIKAYKNNAKIHNNAVLQRINNNWNIEDIVKTPYKSRKKWSELHE